VGLFEIPLEQLLKILTSLIFPIEPTWTEMEETVIINIVLPRILLALLIGGGLAIAGASFQGMFGIPLVSPDILGVSAGAGFNASLGILLSHKNFATQ
ncbi:iron chelate uptake ABC transporter family permease subunit, partial [Bacillus velezensis]|uniref:iron chelate uptake ABC transporter family permease subunit n=1 Tax=Bacillus velezensis TaxID=492670 RepID=UPI00201C7B81